MDFFILLRRLNAREAYHKRAEEVNARRRELYAANKEKVREYRSKRYAEKREIYHSAILRQRAKPEWRLKHKARTILNQQVAKGKIKKPLHCQICSEIKILNAHHDQYEKPLDVQWLCAMCHARVHRLERMKHGRNQRSKKEGHE